MLKLGFRGFTPSLLHGRRGCCCCRKMRCQGRLCCAHGRSWKKDVVAQRGEGRRCNSQKERGEGKEKEKKLTEGKEILTVRDEERREEANANRREGEGESSRKGRV
ncbi:hypothetical protein SESBI_22183 [Sesbania bispinosa]|nr:hypothetical protein SESBI_22183 [Sesbania bispinosa]